MASRHLAPEQLARLAVSGHADPHAAACAACAEELASFRTLVERLRALPDPPRALADAAAAYYRRRRALEGLVERLAGDPMLRRRAVADPEAVLRDAGLQPLPELMEALREGGRAPGEAARRIAAKRLWT